MHPAEPNDNGAGGDYELSADPSKYVTLPVQNEALWLKYQHTLDTFWTVYEVNIERDGEALKEMLEDESQREYLQRVIAFMLITHNTIVTKELFLDLINNVDIKEASYYFSSQADSKKTHSMMYSLILDELIKAENGPENLDEKKAQLMSEVARLPEVHKLLRWYVQNINLEQESFAKKMFTFATLQGIIFAVPFILFSWLERLYPTRMNGLMKSNQLIWRDEKLNLSFSCLLFAHIEDKIEQDLVEEMIKEAVTHAKDVFTKALPVSKLGLEDGLMEQFIEHLADIILEDTQHDTIYNVEHTPFDWVVEPKLDGFSRLEIPHVDMTGNDSTTAQASFMEDDF